MADFTIRSGFDPANVLMAASQLRAARSRDQLAALQLEQARQDQARRNALMAAQQQAAQGAASPTYGPYQLGEGEVFGPEDPIRNALFQQQTGQQFDPQAYQNILATQGFPGEAQAYQLGQIKNQAMMMDGLNATLKIAKGINSQESLDSARALAERFDPQVAKMFPRKWDKNAKEWRRSVIGETQKELKKIEFDLPGGKKGGILTRGGEVVQQLPTVERWTPQQREASQEKIKIPRGDGGHVMMTVSDLDRIYRRNHQIPTWNELMNMEANNPQAAEAARQRIQVAPTFTDWLFQTYNVDIRGQEAQEPTPSAASAPPGPLPPGFTMDTPNVP